MTKTNLTTTEQIAHKLQAACACLRLGSDLTAETLVEQALDLVITLPGTPERARAHLLVEAIAMAGLWHQSQGMRWSRYPEGVG